MYISTETHYFLGTKLQKRKRIARFYVPFVHINPPSRFVPHTILDLGYEQLSQVGYYNENSFNIKAGYKWNQTARTSYEIYPININYLQLGRTTEKFNELIHYN